MSIERTYHTATLIKDEKSGQQQVLVAGGQSRDKSTNTAELYNPTSGKWAGTGSMKRARFSHTAIWITDRDGKRKVLIAGGFKEDQSGRGSAELYDPATGWWTTTGRMNIKRGDHTATLITDRDGKQKVLVVGGENNGESVKEAELYDPATGKWTLTKESMKQARSGHTATLVTGQDRKQKVFIAGGIDGNDPRGQTQRMAELYDPATEEWTFTGPLREARAYHTATLIKDRDEKQKVFIVGGHGNICPRKTAELYDPVTGESALVEKSMEKARFYHTASLIKDNRDGKEKVLVAGGEDSCLRLDGRNCANPSGYSSAELYDPDTGEWTTAGSMNIVQAGHTATVLPDRNVLGVGGFSS